jgi:uncharacterized protein (DUF111 family)
MLLHTTTLGVRCVELSRNILNYSFSDVETPYGNIRIKSSKGYGIKKDKPEFEDVLAAAKKHNVPFAEAYVKALTAIENSN